jgi:hypothetical protein
LTSAIINKILHTPVTLLKQTDEEAMSDLYLDTLHALFGLPEKSFETFLETFEEEKEENTKKEDA